jgi:signal transduction histidine kinase
MERVIRAAERMDHLIGDILDFARASSSVIFPIKPRAADLGEIATTLVDELREGHPDRALELHVAGDSMMQCDPDRIAQALGNLVTNAIQHGEGAVIVSAECREHDVLVEVHNAGVPIPAEAMASLFDPFRACDERPQGLGLGLFIVKEIMRAHGGTVAVRSSQADGTTFELCWPRTAVVGPPLQEDGATVLDH